MKFTGYRLWAEAVAQGDRKNLPLTCIVAGKQRSGFLTNQEVRRRAMTRPLASELIWKPSGSSWHAPSFSAIQETRGASYCKEAIPLLTQGHAGRRKVFPLSLLIIPVKKGVLQHLGEYKYLSGVTPYSTCIHPTQPVARHQTGSY